MQITYEQYQRQAGQAPEIRQRRRRRVKKSAPLGPDELRRLTQLGVSLALFLTVFLGKGVFPNQMEQLRGLLQETTDFKSAFSQLGADISSGRPVAEAVGEWCVAVFSPGQVVRVTTTEPWEHSPTLERERRFLSDGELTAGERLAHRFMEDVDVESPAPVHIITFEGAVSRAAEQKAESPEERVTEDKVVKAAYTGPDLPSNATMDYLPLGLEETVTPVMGVVSSAYGYREHPVDGKYKFHAGVDLAADKYTDIQAFADGVVDFIGKSDAYGNYIQLKHDNGITTFYAHCDELFLPKGTPVSAGDIIATVGDTGNVTGPHLHLEMKVNGVLTDPMDHIEALG